MRTLANGVSLFQGHVEGYGGPGYYWLKVVFQNRLLEEKRAGDGIECGRLQELLKQKWNKKKREQLLSIAEKKTLASPVCHNCKEGTIYSRSCCYIGHATFCGNKACEKAIEAYKIELSARLEKEHKEREESFAKSQQEFKQRQAEHQRITDEFIAAFKEDPQGERFLQASRAHAADEMQWRGIT